MEASTKNTVPLFLLAFLFVLVQSAPNKDVDIVVDKCLAENNITKEEYEMLVKHTSLETKDNDNWDRTFKCYISCLSKDIHILLSEYVKVEKETYGLVEPSANFPEAYYKCKELHDEPIDSCERDFNMLRCLERTLIRSEESK